MPIKAYDDSYIVNHEVNTFAFDTFLKRLTAINIWENLCALQISINVVGFHQKAKKNAEREIVECTLPSDSSQMTSSSSQMTYKLPSDPCQIIFVLHYLTP